MAKVFVDGSAGTTGLRIFERLEGRREIELILLSDELRKDISARRDALNSADIAFLCLPDAAAIESVSLLTNQSTAIIDTSTAHRTNDSWVYGFPELSGLREKIKNSKRIANPGCHASGFVALTVPLVENGLVKKDAALSCFSLTGYSGGGKKMIAEYENKDRDEFYSAPRMYALSGEHKHLKEMAKISQLSKPPVFCPVVADFYSGMQVTVTLTPDMINGDIRRIKECLRDYYKGGFVGYCENADEGGFMSANAFSGRDDMQVSVCGNDERIILVSRFDNLGKGASGSAVQNMNILLGLDESTGLNISEEK